MTEPPSLETVGGEGEQSKSGDAPDSLTFSGESKQYRLPKDVVFDLLSTKRRRQVLEYLAKNGQKTTLGDLAEHIAAIENDTDIRLLSSQQRKRVYVALYQCHLPRLDDGDVVDFETGRGTVELRPNATQLYRHMSVSPVESNAPETNDGPSISDRVTSARVKIEEWVANQSEPQSEF